MKDPNTVLWSFRQRAEEESFNCQGPLFSNSTPGTKTVEWTLFARFGPIGFKVCFTHEPTLEGLAIQWLAFVRARHYLEGDRTDANDIIASMWATYWWHVMGQSFAMVPAAHPVVDGEIDSVWLLPRQPNGAGNLGGANSLDQMLAIVFAAKHFWNFFYQLTFVNKDEQDRDTPDADDQERKAFGQCISRALRLTADDPQTTVIRRINPYWLYFLSSAKGVGVVFAPALAETFRGVFPPSQNVRDVGGVFIGTDQTKHYVPYRALRLGSAVLHALGEGGDTLQVPMENRLVMVASAHIVLLAADCGRTRFLKNWERVRRRRQAESELLFPPSTITWRDVIDPEQFEELVYHILDARPDVEHVRIAGPTRERDGGRDLRLQWRRPVPGDLNRPSFISRLFVVQCKAIARPVSKSHVTDLRDTIERFGAQGYLLVVSSRLTASLIRDLEQLKDRYDVEWWTRLEIEQELRKTPELIQRFPGVFTV